VLHGNYKQAYEGYRMQGKDIEQSKKLALADVADNYKVSNVFRGLTGRGEITRYPIEGRYPPIDAEKPYKWIEEQGREAVKNVMVERGIAYDPDPDPSVNLGSPSSYVDIRLVPTAKTVEEWKTTRQPSYNLMFRNPKTGLVELAVADWKPNQEDAQNAFDEKSLARMEASRKRQSGSLVIGAP
jgi:hypothetical protein